MSEWTLEQPELETRVSPLNHWRILSKSLVDLESQTRLFEERWKRYVADREEEFKDVEYRAANKIAGPVKDSNSNEAKPVKRDAPAPDSDDTQSCFVPRVPKKLEVIGQKFVGIAVVQDSHKDLDDQEPFFQVIAVGDSESEMEEFLKKHSQEQVDSLGV